MWPILPYYWRCLTVALHPSWSVTETVSTLLGLIVPIAAKGAADLDRETVLDLAWQVPLSVFLTLVFVRLIHSPWKIHQETVADIDKRLAEKRKEIIVLERERDEAIKRLAEKPTDLGEIKNFLHIATDACRKCLHANYKKQECLDWLNAAVKSAIYEHRYYLFKDLYQSNDLNAAIMWIGSTINRNNDDSIFNVSFKPAEFIREFGSCPVLGE